MIRTSEGWSGYMVREGTAPFTPASYGSPGENRHTPMAAGEPNGDMVPSCSCGDPGMDLGMPYHERLGQAG